ncbi:hypothetical protein HELRODRAFT_96859 [Helobdella robusta]|uniref:Uncharacterized protein n=1 Tax=Helobdella robusta TaxID=6412 RepID=T1G9D9_HELRO|nr:hypothetical protein HELRODRAFT_96859 [Helobdella robusta]ESO11927.1 hypothetical protein HELRODRAFT_96859 [Helobdella robusta]
MNVFDRKAKTVQKQRSMLNADHTVFDYLKEEVGWRVADRIYDIKRNFTAALDLGCGKGYVGRNVVRETIGMLQQCDLSSHFLDVSLKSDDVPTCSVVVDEEYLPYRDCTFDIVLSSLRQVIWILLVPLFFYLHWINDLPGTFKQVHRILVNDGCFMGSMFGGDTLHELRVSLYLAELERKGGFSPHISPYTSAQDLGSLLQRAGFNMLTIDVDDMTVTYPSMVDLMWDLKGMAENNCSWSRSLNLNVDTILAASAIYQEKYGFTKVENESEVKCIPAQFQIINFIAWKPDKSQLQAAKRGSGEVSMKDLAKLDELMKQIENLRKEEGAELPKMQKNIDELQKTALKVKNIADKSEGDGNSKHK